MPFISLIDTSNNSIFLNIRQITFTLTDRGMVFVHHQDGHVTLLSDSTQQVLLHSEIGLDPSFLDLRVDGSGPYLNLANVKNVVHGSSVSFVSFQESDGTCSIFDPQRGILDAALLAYSDPTGTGSGEATSQTLTQTSHGFAAGDCLRFNGSIWVKAQADIADNSEVQGVVSSVTTDTFILITSGRIGGLSGLISGGVYFLSDTVPGGMTLTEPPISKPVLFADSTQTGFVRIERGFMSDSGGGTGSFGATGGTGSTGSQGNTGVPGSTGSQGNTGVPGSVGSTGSTGSGGSDLYTNAGATPAPIGGIPAGSTFSNISMQTMWDSLLYPYQSPTFTSFSISGQSSPLEVGATSNSNPSFVWGTTNNTNISSNTIGIVDTTTPETLVTGHSATSPAAITHAGVTKTSATSEVYTITGTNTHSVAFSRTYSITWLWRVYYGEDATTPLAEVDIKLLRISSFISGFAGVYSFSAAASQYKYLCYPSVLGAATSFKDQSTNLAVPFEGVYTVSVTNAYGVTTNYNVHRSTNMIGGALVVVVS
jgi:hypothetical protein